MVEINVDVGFGGASNRIGFGAIIEGDKCELLWHGLVNKLVELQYFNGS